MAVIFASEKECTVTGKDYLFSCQVFNHSKMPKKVEVLEALPLNFEVRRAIGPKNFKKIGNAGYVLLPSCFKNSKNLFVVDGEFLKNKKAEDFATSNDCGNCSSNENVVDCPKFNADVCLPCCKKCPIFLKCPIRNPDGP